MAVLPISNLRPVANSDYLIASPEIGSNIYWTKFSGLKVSFKRPQFNDGLSNKMLTGEGGTQEYQPVTLSKPYDIDRDQSVFDFFNRYKGGEEFTLTLTPIKYVNGSSTQGAKSLTLYGCRVSNLTWGGNIDTSDGSQAVELELEFTVEGSDMTDTAS
ncbi:MULTISPECIES: hypothetical protein [Calothrix]|uniref:Phage tail protein n=2 Tax=Calothrix TaxID=1186 RepID=A0ABR8ABE5_9CYAN|nr:MULTISPECIES: hypothetical protein [Calothrix]MBD2196613.1 hypothetical protein [Calothrix parietina FACHB-288]MBD2228022.1 hypothetical protein [Calothrix anomala FACHB-343]